MKHFIVRFILVTITVTSVMNARGQELNWKKINILIYTRNGKGYVHDNIPFAVACLQKLAQQNGFKAEASDDPTKFTEENLKKYSLVIFANTNNDVFDTEEQRLSFRKYMEAGGGFVGIHCVLGTERNWTWFKNMLGGTFAWHPEFQKYKINVIDESHPSVAGTPKVWEKEDECYFIKEIYPGMRVVMAHDITSLDPKEKEKEMTFAGPYNKFYPAVWYQTFDGGNVWITTLGHDKKDYEDPVYLQHLMNGIRFIASSVRKPDYAKAYAVSKDDPLK